MLFRRPNSDLEHTLCLGYPKNIFRLALKCAMINLKSEGGSIMKVKDFVVAFLTEQNINGMAVNLIGNLGKTLRLAQTRYPEYNNLFYDKRLWTGKRDITSCMSYPVTKLEGLYVTANTDETANEQLVQIFKTKLLQLKKELAELPEERPERLLFTGINALFKRPTIFVETRDELYLMLEDKFQASEKVMLARFDFFNLGIFSYKDVAYYELVTATGTELSGSQLEKHDLTVILGQLLAFMTIAGITQADYAAMSAYFSMSNY